MLTVNKSTSGCELSLSYVRGVSVQYVKIRISEGRITKLIGGDGPEGLEAEAALMQVAKVVADHGLTVNNSRVFVPVNFVTNPLGNFGIQTEEQKRPAHINCHL